MPSHIQIYKGDVNSEGFLPFSAFKIPQYSNRPAYSKFKNFLLGKIEKHELRLTCSRAIDALVASSDSLYIDTDKCITCLACLSSIRNPFKLLYSDITDVMRSVNPTYDQLETIFTDNPFNGELKRLPQRKALSLKMDSFNQYTAENEVDNIALWVTIMLQFLASDNDARIGKEIQIANPISPRDNRLDACCVSGDSILIGETKTTLDSLLQENRYRTQIPSYEAVIEKSVQEYNELHSQRKKSRVLLIIGGRETDLLPSDHPDCTSFVGGRSLRFYSDVNTYKIRFISANLLWTMALHSLITRKRLCWDLLFSQVFSNPDVLGILSGGQVVSQGAELTLENISTRVLNSSVQDFS